MSAKLIEKQRLLLNFSSKYLDYNNDDIYFQTIADDLLLLSDASYAIVNLLSDDKSTIKTTAIAGISKHITKATKLLGFDLIGKDWIIDALAAETLFSNLLINQGDFSESSTQIPSTFTSIFKTLFNIGDVYSIGILFKDKIIGTLVMVMPSNEKILDNQIIEHFAKQVSYMLYKTSADIDSKSLDDKLKLKIIEEQSPDLLIMLNPECKIVHSSKSFIDNGQKINKGELFLNIIPEEYQENVANCIKAVFESKQKMSLEIKVNYNDLTNMYFLLKFIPIISQEKVSFVYFISKNITDLKTAESNQIQTNLFLKNTLSAINKSTLVFATDINNVIIEVNDKLCQLSLFNQEEILGQTTEIFRQSDHHSNLFFDHIRSSLEKDKEWSGTIKNKKKNGEYFWVQSTITPFLNDEGVIFLYLHIWNNITSLKDKELYFFTNLKEKANLINQYHDVNNSLNELNKELEVNIDDRTKKLEVSYNMLLSEIEIREQRELDLLESKRKYKHLSEFLPISIIEIDQEDKVNFVNIAAIQLFNIDNSNKDLSLIDFFTKKNKEKVDNIIIKSKSVDQVCIQEFLIDNNINQISVLAYFSRKIIDKNLMGFTIAIVDITDRLAMESKLRLLSEAIEQAKDNILITDKNGIISYANLAAVKEYGYSQFALIGKTSRVLRTDFHDNSFYSKLWKTISSGKAFNAVFENINSKNEKFYEEKTITPVKNNNGEITHFISTGKNITEKIEREQELKIATQLLNFRNSLNECFINISDFQKALDETCRILVEVGNYSMAWIGIVNETTKQVEPQAIFGDKDNYLKNIDVYVDERPEGIGPIDKAIRNNRIIVVQDLINDPSMGFWRPQITNTQFKSTIVMPIFLANDTKIVLLAYSNTTNYFDKKVVETLKSTSNKLKIILDNFELFSKLKETNKLLEDTNQQSKICTWELFLANHKLTCTKEMYSIYEINEKNSPSEKLYEICRSKIFSEDEDKVNNAENNLLVKNLPYDLETRILMKDGRIKYISVRGYKFFNEDGKFISIRGITQDITEKKESEIRLYESKRLIEIQKSRNEKIKTLSLIKGQEEERKRIGRDIHDGIGQMLTALKFNIENFDKNIFIKDLDKLKFDVINGLISDTIAEVRRVSNAIAPPSLYDFGLHSATKQLLDQVYKSASIKIDFESNIQGIRYDSNVEITLYRIIQESLNNILKHSKAKNIEVEISQIDKSIEIIIFDDGIGFDSSINKSIHNNSNGLKNIRERSSIIGGNCSIISSPNNGCRIKITVPISKTKNK